MLKRLLVTGFKASELGIFDPKHPGVIYIKLAIEKQLRQLIEEQELEWVIVSGQLGTEQWAAEVVLELKTEFPNLKLAVMPPFLDQEKRWNEEKQQTYNTILQAADFTKTLTDKPYVAPWQFKAANEFLLKKTDGIFLFYDEERDSSTKFIVEDAKLLTTTREYQLLILSSYDLQLLVEEEQEKLRTDW